MSTLPFPKPQVERPPVISRRTMLTVSAAAGLSGLAASYVVFTRPLLTATGPGNATKFHGRFDELPSPEKDLATRFLPDVPWAAEANYTIRNGRTILFFNEWHPTEDGKAIELKPIAMVFPPKDPRTGEAPLTVVGQGAIMQVQGEVGELESSDPGRIVGGQMPGEVRLRGPDGLDLVGSDFHYDEAALKLWSDRKVSFRQGPHFGGGTGATLQLFRVGAAEAFEAVAVSGLRSISLGKDVEMNLRFDGADGGPLGGLAGDPAATPQPSADATPTQVTCDGSFTFDLYTNQVLFEKNVVAARATPEGGAPDSLHCDSMVVVFEPATDEAKLAHANRWAKVNSGTLTEDDGFQATDGELKVVRLLASGKNTILRSPSNELVAQLTTLTYEAATGITALQRADGNVIVNQGTSQLASPMLQIVPAKDGPPLIGGVGTGWMIHKDESGKTVMTARWSKGLQRARAASGLDLIRLTGDVEVLQPQQSFTLLGDAVELWIDPNEDDQTPGAKRPPAAAFAGGGRMEPRTLVAAGNVKLDSPDLRADANRLDVTFVAPPEPAKVSAREPRTALAPVSRKIRLVSNEVEAPVEPQPHPLAIPPEGGDAGTAGDRPAATRMPLQLVTDAIAVVVERSDDDNAPAPETGRSSSAMAGRGGQVREVHTTGGVTVVHRPPDGEEPLYIEGDRLDLFNRGENQELVQIHGKTTPGAGDAPPNDKPARVHDQGSDLWGMNINLDRRDNVAWVEGKGVLQLPVKNAQGLMGSTASGSPGEADRPDQPGDASGEAPPQRLDVWWQEEMRFNGDKAVFRGNVITQLSGDAMSCEEMEVRMTERFDFAAAAAPSSDARPATQPEVAEVLCRNKVLVRGREYEAGRHVGDRQASFFEFRLDQRTGDTRSVGGGEILIWRKGTGNRAGLTPESAVSANSNVDRTEKKGEWEYIRVKFDGKSVGNIRRRSTTFEDGVEVVYGPVAKSGLRIDPNHPEKVPADAGWMTCDRLTLTQHEKTEAAPAYSEVDAEGNVRLDGRGFSGQADEVMYDESKGQYILRSIGNRGDATIAKWSNDGRGRGESSGQVIQFYPANNTVRVTKSKGGEGIQ